MRSVGFPSPDGGLGCVAGIGSRAWDRLFGAPRPARSASWRGPGTTPRPPGDLFFHIKSARTDLCFALAAATIDSGGEAVVRELVRRLRGTVTVRDETQAFSYFDSRNVLGFVDGVSLVRPITFSCASTARASHASTSCRYFCTIA